MKKILQIIFCFTLLGCSLGKKDLVKGSEIGDKIVFFNLAQSSRSEIAQGLNVISACSPKVIAINGIFKNQTSSDSDTLLANAIRQAGNVVLSFSLVDGELIISDSVFIRASKSQGLVSFGLTDELVTDYEIFTSLNDQLFWNFPAVVAGETDFELTKEIMQKTKGNTRYSFGIHSGNIVINALPKTAEELNCSSLKDKIIMLGYLGPDAEDSFSLKEEGQIKQMYSTVILANIVMTILQKDFHEAE